jgi:hypothetical protein
MSRHHILPPIVYTPEPRPKKTESRPNTRRIQQKAAAASEDVRDTEETGGISGFGGPARAAGAPPQDASTSVEAAERRIPSTTGNLSESTLKELLLAQEHDQESAPGVASAAPAAKR